VGRVGPRQIDRIAAIAAARNVPVMFGRDLSPVPLRREFVSIYNRPGMAERTIILDGFSKSYAMTGWRLGYGIFPQPLVEHITRLMVNSASCTASFVQLAGIAALQGEQAGRMVAEFKRRRDILVDGLNKLPGVKCLRPRGAFYVFPNITGTKRSSAEVAERLLNEAGVAALSAPRSARTARAICGFLRQLGGEPPTASTACGRSSSRSRADPPAGVVSRSSVRGGPRRWSRPRWNTARGSRHLALRPPSSTPCAARASPSSRA